MSRLCGGVVCFTSNGSFAQRLSTEGPLHAEKGLVLLPATRPLGILLSVQSHWHAKERLYFCLTFKRGNYAELLRAYVQGILTFPFFPGSLEVVQVD